MTAAVRSTSTRARKPQTRTVAMPAPGQIRLTVGKVVDTYDIDEHEVEIPGARGFRLTKHDDSLTSYDVLLDGRHSGCECLGHLRHGHCKHLDAIKALISADKL